MEPRYQLLTRYCRCFFSILASRSITKQSSRGCESSFYQNVFEKERTQFPKKLWLDQGKEFFGDMANFCEDVGVKYYHTYSETKVAFGERIIRTLKNLIYRYLVENDTLSYIKDLQMFVDIINSRINRSIRLAPKNVVNADFLTVMYKRMKLRKNKKTYFKVGDKVRLVLVGHNFQKRYKPHYTHEIFLIRKINTLAPFPTYFVVDQKGENIDGIFYEQELSKLNNHFSISRARKWTVTICLILKEFFVREGVALEPWLEQSLEQLSQFSRNTFYLQQKNWTRCNRVSHSRNWRCFIRTDFN